MGADAPLKLTDFGFAANAVGDDGHERLKGRLGTAAYMAPEMWCSAKSAKEGEGYDSSVDIWALGVVRPARGRAGRLAGGWMGEWAGG